MDWVQIYTIVLFCLAVSWNILFDYSPYMIEDILRSTVVALLLMPLIGRVFNWW